MKRGRKRFTGTLILVLMLGVICFLVVKTVFVVRSVDIIGNYSYNADDIIRVSGVLFGKPLSNVDASDVERNINATGKLKFESLQLKYPNTVEICVEERKAAAMLLHVGNILVLDSEGCVMEVNNQVPNEDLIYISDLGVVHYSIGSVAAGDSVKMEAYEAVMEAIEYHGAGRLVSEINFHDGEDIRIITRSGITVRLGNSGMARNKIAWMKAVVADLERLGETGGTLDVSSAARADYMPAK